jgi:DNA-binding GntR family transcriptional regulator
MAKPGGSPPRLPRRLLPDRPKGEQLREILEDHAASLPPGSPLPSERELAERYGVARMTVRGEIQRLTSDGVTYRAHGRGTFVAESRVAQAMALTSFTEDMLGRGMEPSSRVLTQRTVRATDVLAARLELKPGAALVRLDRVRFADDLAMAVEEAHLPLERLPGVEDADFAGASLFGLLSERWGVELDDADQRVVAMAIEADAAALLGVEPGFPGLRFETLARDRRRVPVYCATSLYRGDRYEIDLRQVRSER